MGPFKLPIGGQTVGIGLLGGLTIDPTDPSLLYVFSPHGGIWKSINSGS